MFNDVALPAPFDAAGLFSFLLRAHPVEFLSS